jgi:type I restriction enzyme R subunit
LSDKRKFSERDICTQYINPALQRSGRDLASQVREEVSFTNGRIIVRGKQKHADHVLYYAPNLPIAVIESLVQCGMSLNEGRVSTQE